MDDLSAPERAPALVIQVGMNPACAKIIDHLCSERLRYIAAEIGQHPPVHTRRVLDEHVAEITSFRAELRRAIANPIEVPIAGPVADPVPDPGGGE